VVINYLIP